MGAVKKFFLLLFIFIIIILIALIAIGIFVYLFVPFTVASFCVSAETVNLGIACSEDVECKDILEQQLGSSDQFSNLPEIVQERFAPILDSSILCMESQCHLRDISIIEGGGLVQLASEELPTVATCDEEVINVEFYGKDLWRLYKESNL